MSEYLNEVIVRADSRGKILDFRDNLIIAKDSQYAMMHGSGGKNRNPNSTIKAFITDYSKGTGDASVTVSANMRPELFGIISDICLKNSGYLNIGEQQNLQPANAEPANVRKQELHRLISDFKSTILSAGKTDTPDQIIVSKDALIKYGRTFREWVDRPIGAGMTALPQTYDFTRKEEKVNTYKVDLEGNAFVTVLQITRQGIRKNCEVSRMPWNFNISNFYAKPITHENGTISYNSKTAVGKKEAYFALTDEDMFRCCTRVTSFVRVWENALLIPLVVNAAQIKESKRESREAG